MDSYKNQIAFCNLYQISSEGAVKFISKIDDLEIDHKTKMITFSLQHDVDIYPDELYIIGVVNLDGEIFTYGMCNFKQKTIPFKEWCIMMKFLGAKHLDVTLPTIANVILKEPYTIVRWTDGVVTKVKCVNGDIFDPEAGINAAIARRYFEERNPKSPRKEIRKLIDRAKKYTL